MTFEDDVIDRCNEFDNRDIYPGIACDCEDCQSAFGLSSAELREGAEDGSVFDEGGFSWQSCECCKSSLGGNRYAAHGFVDGELCHLDVCEDCLCYLANGDLPAND